MSAPVYCWSLDGEQFHVQAALMQPANDSGQGVV